jgi:hypothetical protein
MSETDWTGFSGYWGDAAYWTGGVPTADSQAIIGGTNGFTLRLAAAESYSVGSVLVSDANAVFDLAGTLAVGTAFTLAAGQFNLSGVLEGGTLDNTGGNVGLDGGTLDGTTIAGADGIQVNGTGTLDAASNESIVFVGNHDTLDLVGTIDNSGTIELQAGNYDTALGISGLVQLQGGGTVLLSDATGTGNLIYGGTLDNIDNTISGAGQFGVGANSLDLVNAATGVINANLGNALTIDTGETVINQGLIEATGAGGLIIDDTIANSGTIGAYGGVVTLNGATILGGLLASSGGASVQTNGTATIDGVTSSGTLFVGNHDTLGLVGTITNAGTIELQAGNYATGLGIQTSVTLDGGGTVLLSNATGTANLIYGTGTLDNLDNIIIGSGVIEGSLTLTNAGTIAAANGNALVLATSTAITNTGLIEDTGGGVVIESTIDGGTLEAVLAGSVLTLQGGALNGVTLTTANGGMLSVNGSGTLVDPAIDGLVFVGNHDTLGLVGTIDNTGTIELQAGNYATGLGIQGNVLLQGGGTVLLSDATGTGNLIYGGTLDNIDNTISGAGQFGVGANSLDLVNGTKGVIDSNLGAGLTFDTGETVTNRGLIEATNGSVTIDDTIANSGTIGAYAGVVTLNGATILGGLLATSGTGFIQTNGTATIDGVTSTGTLFVGNHNTLDLVGTITNSGTIELQAGNYATGLGISGTVMLQGGGTVLLSNATGTGNLIYGGTLDNVDNTILGAGAISTALALVNGGTIDAEYGNALVFNATNAVTNTGLIEDTGTGGVIIDDVIGNTGGRIGAYGNGAFVDLSGGTITGGMLATGTGGTFETGGSATIEDLTTSGRFFVGNHDTLDLVGTITNSGTIELQAGNYATGLGIENTVTLQGGGTVLLSDAAGTGNLIYGGTLDNVDNTILGVGTISTALALVNGGTIDAEYGTALTFNATNAVTNSGLIEDTGTGGVIIDDVIDNTGGRIGAYGNGAFVDLSGGTITGGTLVTGTGGTFETGGSATIEDLSTTGQFFVGNHDTLDLVGTITNSGTIELQAGNYDAGLGISGTVTLQGGGTVLLSNATGTGNLIYGGTLDNVDNTIIGAGLISTALALVNGGTIDAEYGSALVFNATNAVTNTGLIEDTGTGGVIIDDVIDNIGGRIGAYGNGAFVDLSGGTITGGTLATGTGGTFETGGTATIEDLSTTGRFFVGSHDTLDLVGTITNSGTIELQAGNYDAGLGIENTVTLRGGGTVLLSNATGTGNLIYGTGTLDNVGNTITGVGRFANGLTLVNGGIIDASAGNALVLATGNVVTNTGLLEDTATGGLVIDDAVANAGGTIGAFGAGAVVDLAGGTIAGGTLTTSGGGTDLVTANLLLNGTTDAVSNRGLLAVGAGITLGLVGSLDNAGTIESGGTAIAIAATGVVTNRAGATISGAAGVVFAATASGTVYNDGTIESTAGAGGIAVQFGAENDLLELGAAGVFIGTVDGGGGTNTLELTSLAGPGTLTGLGQSGFSFTNFSIFEIDAGATWTLAGTSTLDNGDTLTDSGFLATTGSFTNDGVLAIPGYLAVEAGAFVNAGTIIGTAGLGHAVNLTANGTVLNTGMIEATSVGILLHAGGSVDNQGDIIATGASGVGIYLADAGSVTNTGTIEGGGAGLYLRDGTLTNQGLIQSSGIGVELSGAGLLVNQAGGMIEGAIGAELFGGPGGNGTIINAGTIEGTGGGAAVVLGSPGGVLEWDAGGVFIGAVEGGGGTLALDAGSAATGTLAGLGSSIAGFSLITIEAAASWQFSGGNTLAASATLEVAGTLANTGSLLVYGSVGIEGDLSNDGTIDLVGGTLTDSTTLYGGGLIEIADFGTLNLGSGDTGGTINFADATGMLVLGDPMGVGAEITGFQHGDTIDLTGVAFSSADTVTYAAGHVLVYAGGEIVADLLIEGLLAGASVALQSDGHGGTDLIDPTGPPCFLRGTSILTDRGAVAVEDLRPGDAVATLTGRFERIRWIGSSRIDPARIEVGRSGILPILIRAGALGASCPARDLLVSPEHCLYVAASLVPARMLVNGTSIVQRRDLEMIQYFHIELDRHAVLFAEGAAAESYREVSGNRDRFDTVFGVEGAPAEACAPILLAGPEVDAVRRALDPGRVADRARAEPTARGA